MDIKWNYEKRICDISIKGYTLKQLKKFKHIATKLEHSPSKFSPPIYGQKTQLTKPKTKSKQLSKEEIKTLQQVIGSFLFYGRVVDSTLLHALNSLASDQAKATENTKADMTHLLNYCGTNPEVTVRFTASDMILKVHSDASYLSESEARSRAGGYFYLGDKHNKITNNGPIHILAKIIKNVVSSAAEVEIAAIFMNAKDACPIRTTLEEMGHKQPPTTIITDNATAADILNNNMKQLRSKAIDMRYYWVQDRIKQKQFNLIWKSGKNNLADYTKRHSPTHHKNMRSTYLHCPNKTEQTNR